MEYSKEFRVGPGLCRCCLSEGCYKEITNEYVWMGEKEIYAEMLKECFDICLKTYNIEADKALICEVCITRLRDASNFKKQVLNAESCMKAKCKGDFKEKFDNTVPAVNKEKEEQPETTASVVDDMKVESIDNEYKSEDESFMDTQFLDEAFDFDDPVKMLSEELQSELSETKRKKRTPVETKIKIRKKKKFNPDDAPTTSTRVYSKYEVNKRNEAYNKNKSKKKITYRFSPDKLQELNKNILTLLTSSTALPFKIQQNCYTCFYCNEAFDIPECLFKHNSECTSTKAELECLIETRDPKDRMIFVDITNLNCTICNVKLEDLPNLQLHLESVHDLEFNEECGEGLIPFRLKIDEFQCQICFAKYASFHHLNQHMNDHFRNYACELCGKTFADRRRFICHLQIHDPGFFTCKECEIIFDKESKRHDHIYNVHKTKSYNCNLCDSTFETYFKKRMHLIDEHKLNLLTHKCSICNKRFRNNSLLDLHKRRIHNKEKNYVCEVCGWSTFSVSQINRHVKSEAGKNLKHENFANNNLECYRHEMSA